MTAVRIETRTYPSDLSHFQGIHPRLARILSSRGVTDRQQLEPGLEYLLSDQQMHGIETAVDRLLLALKEQQFILIVGDFDCDGATSTVTGLLALGAFGFKRLDYLVPNRFEYGYGLSPEIVEVAAQQSPDLIITVDNGIASVEGVARANGLGIDVIVTDHHLPGRTLPNACAIVNPNQTSCTFPAKSTCGVGVLFYLMIALRRALTEQNWFQSQGMATPNLAQYLDLVALGTVADVVPLEANNRRLIHQGLERIRRRRARPGLLALLEIAGRNPEKITATDLAFAVAPRLNAAGRLDDISLGIECLLTEQPERARELAAELDGFNQDRRLIEQQMQKEAADLMNQLELNTASPYNSLPGGLALFDQRWHQGVVGILASRLKEQFNRPVIVFAPVDDGMIKGSARSLPGYHIRDALDRIATRNPGLIKHFGGHAMAAGMTLAQEKFSEFQCAFARDAEEQLSDAVLQRTLITDGELEVGEFTLEFAQLLRDAGPWGHEFPEPTFYGRFWIVQQRLVAHKHLKLVLQLPDSGVTLDAISFNVDRSVWPAPEIKTIEAVYRLDVNEFRGNTQVQLMIDWLQPEGEIK